MRPHSDFLAGCRQMLPIMMGVVPMAVVTGLAVVNDGFNRSQALMSSLFTYAAASQLLMGDMIAHGAGPWTAVLAGLVLNLRFMMYSAVMAPHLHGSAWRKALAAYVLTDQAFGLSVGAFQAGRVTRPTLYFLGAGWTMWVIFQLCALVGIWLGEAVPAFLRLDFAVPLTFTVLLVPLVARREHLVAALGAGGLALLGRAAGWGPAGFFLAVSGGMGLGLAWGRLAPRWVGGGEA